MNHSDNHRPLDYETDHREPRKRPVRLKYLVPALLCFALAYAGWLTVKKTDHVLMPMVDPPLKGDPYWQQHARDLIWLPVACCSTPLFGIAGFVLLVESFLDSESRYD